MNSERETPMRERVARAIDTAFWGADRQAWGTRNLHRAPQAVKEADYYWRHFLSTADIAIAVVTAEPDLAAEAAENIWRKSRLITALRHHLSLCLPSLEQSVKRSDMWRHEAELLLANVNNILALANAEDPHV